MAKLFNFSSGKLMKHILKINPDFSFQESHFSLQPPPPPQTQVRSNWNSGNFSTYENGFFKQSDDGWENRRFLFLPRYDIKRHRRVSAMHLFKCETVVKYRNFISSNAEKVSITCTSQCGNETTTCSHCYDTCCGNQTHEVSLDLCKRCGQILQEKTGKYWHKDGFANFILQLEESLATRNTRIGKDGYVTNWPEISYAYRKINRFTCEKCYLDLSTYQHWLHVHHIDQIKTNNGKANLQSLCIRCHSEVDDVHRRNLTTGTMGFELNMFNRVFPLNQ